MYDDNDDQRERNTMTHTEYVDVLVGGQYGSEGKGAVAAAMVEARKYDLLVRVAGPNAGHTVIDRSGTPRALRQLPAAGVLDHVVNLYIAPGSELDLGVLEHDIETFAAAGAPVAGRLYISPEVTVIEDIHHNLEASPTFGYFGSTRKGVGAARAARVMRKAKRVCDVNQSVFDQLGAQVGQPPDAGQTLIEGCQGYWLGSHAGLYPYCTSSDCRAIDFLAMSGLSWGKAWATVVFRSLPIRIAGNSGPLQDETTWEEIGVPPEFTTVTKKMRRVGRWEPDRVEQAIADNYVGHPPRVAMTFMDYLSPHVEQQFEHAVKLLGHRSNLLRYVGNGPQSGFWT